MCIYIYLLNLCVLVSLSYITVDVCSVDFARRCPRAYLGPPRHYLRVRGAIRAPQLAHSAVAFLQHRVPAKPSAHKRRRLTKQTVNIQKELVLICFEPPSRTLAPEVLVGASLILGKWMAGNRVADCIHSPTKRLSPSRPADTTYVLSVLCPESFLVRMPPRLHSDVFRKSSGIVTFRMSGIQSSMSPLADRIQCWRLVQDAAGFRFSQLLRRDQAPDDNCNYLRSLDWGIALHLQSSVHGVVPCPHCLSGVTVWDDRAAYAAWTRSHFAACGMQGGKPSHANAPHL